MIKRDIWLLKFYKSIDQRGNKNNKINFARV